MRKPKRRTVALLGVFAGLALAAYVELSALGWPWFAPLATYLLIIAICAFIWRDALLAVRGNLLMAQGKEAQAAAALKRVVERGIKSPAAHSNYALLLLRRNKPDEALPLLEKAKTLKPSLMAAKNIEVTIGSCYWVRGDIVKAIEVLENMRVTFEYVNANVLTTLGFLYILNKDYAKAREITGLALAEAAEAYAAWDNMGQIAYYEGDMDAAEEAFLHALGVKSDYVDSLYFMGLLREGQGNRAEAAGYFRRASVARISPMNAVTPEQLAEKVRQYADVIEEDDEEAEGGDGV